MDGTNLEGNEVQKLNDPWLTQDATIKEIEGRKLPVSYSDVISNAKVVFLAENHSNHSIRRHIANHARDLRDAGITHYAIEANEEGNKVLERLNSGKHVDLSQIDVGPGRADYEEAIRALSAQGIKVVAIDIDQRTKPSNEEREARITKNINRIIETDPNSKVAVLIGAFHTSRYYISEGVPSVGRRLMEAQVPAVNVLFAGGEDDVPRILINAVSEAGLGNQEFMLDFRPYADLNSVPFGKGEADWVVHLPKQARASDSFSFGSSWEY